MKDLSPTARDIVAAAGVTFSASRPENTAPTEPKRRSFLYSVARVLWPTARDCTLAIRYIATPATGRERTIKRENSKDSLLA